MTVHKLHIDEFDEIDYQLIAIHTSLDDYRLAYYINQKLPVLLRKSRDEIQIRKKEGIIYFARYVYECIDRNICWNLIHNQGELIVNDVEQPSLFGNSMAVATKVYLLPEMKKVNYFLKVEDESIPTNEISVLINSIDRISTVYPVDTKTIKSKNNLIF